MGDPADANAAFVAAMEDVLEVYTRRMIQISPSSVWTRPQSN